MNSKTKQRKQKSLIKLHKKLCFLITYSKKLMLSTSGDDDEIKMRTLLQMFKNLFNFSMYR